MRKSSSAGIWSAVSISASARFAPTMRGSDQVPPASGTSAILAKACCR
jgi:hypothetical protein